MSDDLLILEALLLESQRQSNITLQNLDSFRYQMKRYQGMYDAIQEDIKRLQASIAALKGS